MPTDEIQKYIDSLKTTDENKSAIWNTFYQTQNLDEFTTKIDAFKDIDDRAKADLWNFKVQQAPLTAHEIQEVPGLGVRMPSQTAPGFGEALMNRVGGAAKGGAEIVSALGDFAHPEKTIDLMKGMAQPHIELGKQAYQQFQAGNMPQAAASGLLSAVPVMGPQLAQWGQQVAAGNYGQAGGEITADLLMSVVPTAIGKIVKNPTALLNPVERSAMEFAVRKNIHVDFATGTQSPFFSGLQANLEKVPFIGGRIKKSQARTQADLMRVGTELADEVYGASPIVQSNLRAGMSLKNAAEQKLDTTIGKQQERYGKLDQLAQQNLRPIQTGWETVPDPNGGVKKIPIIENLAGPVDVRFIKLEAKKILERFDKAIPEVQRDASPGYQAVKHIAEGPDYVGLQTAIDNGSALGARAASDLPGVKNASQAIASKIYAPLQEQITKTAASMGDEALRFLNEGREFTKQKYDLIDLKDALGEEPGQIASNLIKGAEKSYETLRMFKREFPNEIPNLAKATLEELLHSHTTLGRLRGAGTEAAWSKIGPETKLLLFDNNTQLIKDLNDFFNTARMVGVDANPSQSGKVLALGAGGMYALTHPMTAMPYVIGAGLLTEIMYGPGGATLLRRALTQKAGTKMGYDTAMRLWVAANAAQQSQPGQQPPIPIRQEGQRQ